jgi:hypothetical protein
MSAPGHIEDVTGGKVERALERIPRWSAAPVNPPYPALAAMQGETNSSPL